MSAEAPIAGGSVSDAARAQAAKRVGDTVKERYRIEELVAMGGLAAVYRAKRLASGEDVALKVLHPDVEGLPELIARFEREAVAGQHNYHPNVAAVHEIDQLADGSWFLAQEFIRGETLRALIDRGPVPAARAARIARQLAAALNAAHDMDIVHRDLKPLNVMVLDRPAGDDHIQLIDFGLAKVPVEHLSVADEDSRRSLTQAGVVFGTVAYMAPETALGMRALDKRADLYALGVIVYEMLAGKHPFAATNPVALFEQQRKAVPLRIADRTPGVEVPPALEAVVRRLLEKDPDERYPNARALIVALDAAIEAMETKRTPSLVPPGLASLRPAPVARWPRSIVAVVVAVAVAVIAAAWWLVR